VEEFVLRARYFLRATGAAVFALGVAMTAYAQTAPGKAVWSEEYWAQKGDVKLYLYRKRSEPPKPGAARLPVLFLVHGSSISGRSTFDLDVPGHGIYSLMDTFAGYGFDVWTMDFEGYGRSSRTAGNSAIAEGVRDLKAATDLVIRETGQRRLHFFGESSGGLRAEEDLISFFVKLPNRDKQLIVLPGMSHSVALGLNRDQLWHVMRSFLEVPARRDHLGQ
jgi:alpha-beta hydrolase superfamily lysophospholipase